MSTPTRPVSISSPRASQGERGTPSSVTTGTPDLRALRAGYVGTPPPPNIPLRGTPNTAGSSTPRAVDRVPSNANLGVDFQPANASTRPSVGGISARRPSALLPEGVAGTSGSGRNSPAVDIDELPEEQKAKILRKHLVSKGERDNHSDSEGGPSRHPSDSHARQDTDPFPVPYHAPGADVTHDIYKWQQDQRRQARPRAASFAGSANAAPRPGFEHIHEPGGFRRNYVMLHANDEEGSEPPRMLRNFIDFLYLFGHFAGEDLEEIEEEEEEEEEEAPQAEEEEQRRLSFRDTEEGLPPFRIHAIEPRKPDSETTPLLGRVESRSRSRSRLRRASIGPRGDATVGEAILMLLKSFVGTGVLFLGKAFFNGGILFSAITLSAIALISLYSFLLLIQVKFVVNGSFGDLGGTLYGPWMRYAILASIAVSQIGFVSAYTIFIAESLQAFVAAVTHCATIMPVIYLIFIQLLIFLPMALIRNLAKLSTAALVADVFILAGLLYIFGSEISLIATRGIAKVELFNPTDFPLLIGTAVFSFEGIGLVIPITDSMREPHKFPAVLSGVMIFLLVLFGGAGCLSYLAFGPAIKTVVITNLDSSSPMVQAVQLLYSLAILLSVPLQLFPAVRIMENGIFGPLRSGKRDRRIKWMKNGFRTMAVLGCAGLSWGGAKDLDKFVAFVGSFACVPLCYVYPALLHYKACAKTRKQKAADIALFVFGAAAAVYTTVQTVRLMVKPEPEVGPPVLIGCDAPNTGLF
ncbi:hypothetical protein EWM64_g5412 [Hericium alpestre]|uniref:Amino acid transporter transmembrane domain-containing protein n=1 Tax=Hericium alpestre TaxID=135208 RepID=A0A4Y9ZYW6_9AGAM|nr:hypothetical protein EWM64_g5412 [Hericium alpestre]